MPMDREVRIVVDEIITAVKAYDTKKAINAMELLVKLVGEESAEIIFDKIETMLLEE